MNIEDVNKTINESLSFFDGPIMSDFIRLFIIVFATKFVPPLPDTITGPVNNILLRILAIFIIVWLGNKNPTRALAVAIGFVLAINLISGRGPFEDPKIEGFEETEEKSTTKVEKVEKKAKKIVEDNNRQAERILDDFGIPMALPYEDMTYHRF